MKILTSIAAALVAIPVLAHAQQEPAQGYDMEFFRSRYFCIYAEQIYSLGSVIVIGKENPQSRIECVYDSKQVPDPRDGKFGKIEMMIAHWKKVQ